MGENSAGSKGLLKLDQSLLKTCWNSLLQPYTDYGSVLVCPFTKGEKAEFERPIKAFTKMAYEAKNLYYWECLNLFKLYSNERRMERYHVNYILKSLNGHMPSLGLERLNSSAKTGWHLKYQKIVGPTGSVRSLHRNSIN